MSKTGKSADGSAAEKELSFEEAVKRLQAIVEAMESQELPLETLLARYEEGVRLSRLCQARLAEAELKLQQLEKTANGQLQLTPVKITQEEGKA